MARSSRKLWAEHLAGKGRAVTAIDPKALLKKVPYSGRVLGVDPSLRGMGLAVVEFEPKRPHRLLDSLTLKLKPKVPFVDCLTTILDASLPLTPPEWTEWGNPVESRAVHDLMQSYSPYDNVAAMDYPAMLITGGLTDPRVTYWEPAKWAAKLRATRTNDSLLLLQINMDSGHGGSAGRFDKLNEIARNHAFLLKVFGRT